MTLSHWGLILDPQRSHFTNMLVSQKSRVPNMSHNQPTRIPINPTQAGGIRSHWPPLRWALRWSCRFHLVYFFPALGGQREYGFWWNTGFTLMLSTWFTQALREQKLIHDRFSIFSDHLSAQILLFLNQCLISMCQRNIHD